MIHHIRPRSFIMTPDDTPSTLTPNPAERHFDICSRPAKPTANPPPHDHIDSDASSELSSSSEEPSDDDDDELAISADNDEEEAVVNVRANRGQKPVIKLDALDAGDDIRIFLKDFLPKLKAANEELEAQKAAGTFKTAEIIDDEEQDEQEYIELVGPLALTSACTC